MAKTATTASTNPPPAFRVFISSTYEDMKEYRVAASAAMTNVEAIPMGMERFTATSMPPIERCYEEIRQCQYCVCLLGFRYGSLYKDSNLSYSELEFNEAERLGLPILVFIQSGSIDPDKIDLEDFSRREAYKKRLQSSASNRLTARFTTVDDLRDKLSRALQDEFKRKESGADSQKRDTDVKPTEEYIEGASVYKNFLLMPAEYTDRTVRLRVRMDGVYGSWKLKEELFEAYNLPLGKILYINDVFVIGADYSDVGDEAKHIDLVAVGEAAKQIRNLGITRGSVFEADVKLEWRYVKNIAGKAHIQIGARDAYIAKLIVRDPTISLITKSSTISSPADEAYGIDDVRSIQSQGELIELLKRLT